MAARSAARAAAVQHFRRIGAWAPPVGVALVYLSVPELRPGLNSLLGLGYLLGLWYVLARTKTLSGQALAAMFALGLPWSVAVAGLTAVLADGPVEELGARTAIAAVAESGLLLVPLLVLAEIRPVRVRGFSATDWLLAGFTLGLSFQAVEELARLGSGSARYGLSPLAGGLTGPDAGFAGRPVLIALITASIGLASAAWRHTANPGLSPVVRTVWRVFAVLLPLGAWWLTVSAQAGWNATVVTSEQWLNTADPSVPWLLRLGWRLGQHGFALGPLLLVLLLIGLLVDAVRLRNAAEHGEDPLPYPFAPTRAADRWAGRLTGWAGTRTAVPVAAAVWLIAASCAVAAYAVRDLVVVLVAPMRVQTRPGSDQKADRESRWSAIIRARQAGVMVRTIRAEAMALATGPDTPAARRVVRIAGGLGLAVVLLMVFWVAPHWATGVGNSVTAADLGPVAPDVPVVPAPIAWLAGAPAAQASWWGGLALWQFVVLGLGAVSLLLLTAGPLDPALVGGRSTWLAARTPIGDRRVDRVRSYLLASSPVELMVDGVGAMSTFLPERIVRRFAGGRTGPEVRRAVHQFASAPSAFVIERRAAARAAEHRAAAPATVGAGRVRAASELPAVKLADGRLLSPLTADDERLFVAALEDLSRDLSRGAAKDSSAGAEYRERIYGDDERLISLRPEKWSDGQNTGYGMVADTVHYDGRGSSWYVPDTLPESIRRKANLELDRRLIEFATVVYYPASPFRAVEITTDHPLVAHVLEERMARLAIPGYVVLES